LSRDIERRIDCAHYDDEKDDLMPPVKSGKLAPNEIELLTAWVKSGAKVCQAWSYEKPVRFGRPSPPRAIDAFILARLERKD
jgi:hypothetical protein